VILRCQLRICRACDIAAPRCRTISCRNACRPTFNNSEHSEHSIQQYRTAIIILRTILNRQPLGDRASPHRPTHVLPSLVVPSLVTIQQHCHCSVDTDACIDTCVRAREHNLLFAVVFTAAVCGLLIMLDFREPAGRQLSRCSSPAWTQVSRHASAAVTMLVNGLTRLGTTNDGSTAHVCWMVWRHSVAEWLSIQGL